MTHRILFTNNTLATRAGSELYLRDLAIELRKLGHTPIAYSTSHGDVARDLRAATIAVVERLEDVAVAPDIIHGQHHLETMTALTWFPNTPAIYVCHGWLPYAEKPPRHPRIARYVAVDDVVRERLVLENGIDESKVVTLLNFVVVDKFKPSRALPARPRRALVFSNQAGRHTDAIREACEIAGLEIDVIGLANGNPTGTPEAVLGEYDVVFAKARAAIEAMSCGAAVILADAVGAGPLVTSHNFDELRRINFGIRSLQGELTAEHFVRELASYDAAEAAAVTGRIRAAAGLREAVAQYEALYDAVIAESVAVDPIESSRAVGRYLQDWSREFKEAANRVEVPVRLEVPAPEPPQEPPPVPPEIETPPEPVPCPEPPAANPDRELLEAAQAKLAELERSPFFRMRERVHRTPALRGLYRFLTGKRD